MKCALCSSPEAGAYARWADFTVQECAGCGFRFIDTSVPGYPDNAQYVHDEPPAGSPRPDAPHIRRRVRDVMRFKSPPGRALDIGCGTGEVSLALSARGFVCVGIDMKPQLISRLQTSAPQATWRNSTADDLARLGEKFDVVTLYHVLEHVPDVRAVLQSVLAVANSGALVVIEVPNVGGWEARLKGPRWHYYNVDHVSYFRRSDLTRLAADFGLSVLDVRGYQHFSYPQDVPWKDAAKGALGLLGFQDVISVFLRVP